MEHQDIMEKFDYLVWGDFEKQFLTILNDIELYTISAEGWFYTSNLIKVCTTKQEALSFLGFNSEEEYEEYKKNCPKDREGFWYYNIEKFDPKTYLKVIKDNVASEAKWEGYKLWNEKNKATLEKENLIKKERVNSFLEKLNKDIDNFYNSINDNT